MKKGKGCSKSKKYAQGGPVKGKTPAKKSKTVIVDDLDPMASDITTSNPNAVPRSEVMGRVTKRVRDSYASTKRKSR